MLCLAPLSSVFRRKWSSKWPSPKARSTRSSSAPPLQFELGGIVYPRADRGIRLPRRACFCPSVSRPAIRFPAGSPYSVFIRISLTTALAPLEHPLSTQRLFWEFRRLSRCLPQVGLNAWWRASTRRSYHAEPLALQSHLPHEVIEFLTSLLRRQVCHLSLYLL